MKVLLRSLRSQLLMGLLAIIVASGALASLANSFWAHRALDEMVQSNDRATAGSLAQALAEFYRKEGSWTHLTDEVTRLMSLSPDQFLHEDPAPGRRGNDVPLIIADRDGNKVFDGLDHGDARTRALARQKMDTASARTIEVDGRVVGYLQFKSMIMSGLSRDEQVLLDSINTTLAITLTLQVGIALVLGTFLSSRLVRPLRLLEAGVKRIAEGESREQVSVRGDNEIASLARNFNRMVDQLEAQEQSRRNLFADVAHELRTPVAILQANLEMMIEGVYPTDRDRLSSLHEETRLLTKLIGDLRTISDLELNNDDVSLETLPLGQFVAECAGNYQPFFREKQIELQTSVDTGDLLVRADPHRLTQVMGNLLENALRYAHEGPMVEVRVERLVPETGGPSCVRVSVNDQGPGVTELEVPRIFDRFYRTEVSRNRDKGGRGLGLAIVKQIIEASGGSVGSENRQPHGLRVWFELPGL